MLVDQISATIEAARSVAALDHVAKLVWQALGSDALAEAEADALLSLIQGRRQAAREAHKPVGIPPGRPSIFPPRRPQPSPRTARCLARRRQLAASGPLPPQLAAHFTLSEMAVLRIVRDEVRARGACAASIAEIAARAGVGRTTVQNAIRRAAKLCLVIVQERRRQGDTNLPNVIRIVSREWAAWNNRPQAKAPTPIGFKLMNPTDNQSKRQKGFSMKRARGGGRNPPDPAPSKRPAPRAGDR